MAEDGFSTWPAPAKINLFLHVTGRRDDGYHELQTLFQLLDWGDDIRIRTLEHSRVHRLPVSYSVPEDEDLVVRAALLLQRETGCALGAEIGVTKRIPPGSGMGGGSSDAASVLLVLNQLWGCELSVADLSRLGRLLGADVPVFINGHSAIATGVGDVLQPVCLGERAYVLIFPGFPLSTREVFADPELKRNSAPVSVAEAMSGGGRNDCESVVRKRFPEFQTLMKSLEKWGPARMTGTGSGVFIEMRDKKTAMSAAEEMKSLYNVRAVSGVDRSPVHEKLCG